MAGMKVEKMVGPTVELKVESMAAMMAAV